MNTVSHILSLAFKCNSVRWLHMMALWTISIAVRQTCAVNKLGRPADKWNQKTRSGGCGAATASSKQTPLNHCFRSESARIQSARLSLSLTWKNGTSGLGDPNLVLSCPFSIPPSMLTVKNLIRNSATAKWTPSQDIKTYTTFSPWKGPPGHRRRLRTISEAAMFWDRHVAILQQSSWDDLWWPHGHLWILWTYGEPPFEETTNLGIR